MPSRLTGKQRAARIPLDYYKKRDRLTRWKLGMSAFALIAAVGWFVSGFSFGGVGWIRESNRGRLKYSRGPLARVHAIWDAKCEACHAPFQSIEGEKWASRIGLAGADSERRCIACHQVADHSQHMKAAEVGSCASCHRDHQGREASLIQLADASCINCHGDLKNHTKGMAGEFANRVVGFPDGHPEFKAIAAKTPDPGTIKFNHALHLTAGLNETKGGKPVLTFEQLDERAREKYGHANQKLTDGVVLTCASCHQLDSSGTYYQPIKYENDCKSCHKLTAALAVGKLTTPLDVPHNLPPEALHQYLTNASIGASMTRSAKLEPKTPRIALPGRTPAALLEWPDGQEVASRVSRAERMLFAGAKATCTECHYYETARGRVEEVPANTAVSSLRISPQSMTRVWFENARFDHKFHRGVSCVECHDAKISHSSKDVMLAGRAKCADCHSVESTSRKTYPTGGAGNSCVECHKYHGGGHGGSKLSAGDGRDIESFLSGSPNKNIGPAKAP